MCSEVIFLNIKFTSLFLIKYALYLFRAFAIILHSFMLRLQNISVLHFKNYTKSTFQFSEKIIGICGSNGVGKTNLLDAIYYLCFTKSYFTRTDSANVHHGLQGMRIEGEFLQGDSTEKVVCILRENNKKEVSCNGEDYKKLSHHIGKFPAVMVAPDDVALITGNSDVRRKFLDTLLSQIDHQYLQNLIVYNKVLQQRNSLLKAFAEKNYRDNSLLEVLTRQLVEPGDFISTFRKEFLEKFLPAVANRYLQIAGTEEPVLLQYVSPLLEENFEKLLEIYLPKDLILQRTSMGIHKDDVEVKLNGDYFKNIASQGQRKSLLFALKLDEMEQIKATKGFSPILLLDDVFEKLDAGRMQNLLHQVCVENDCQVFITDTHKDRLMFALEKLERPYQLIEL